MQLPDGGFCLELERGDPSPHGRFPRYTAMVDLGLRRAADAGYVHGFDFERITSAVFGQLAAPDARPGDLGLCLWVDARSGRDRGAEILDRLDGALERSGGLAALEGQELAWIVLGLAHQRASSLDAALAQLLANQAASGLLYHAGTGRRRRFPNFATQIYGVLALTTAARLALDGRALDAARAAADRLLELQLADGGWPWLYDAERGRVVERYEVYSVHQHAMAPMALLELFEATGDERYVEAARHGLDWIHGRNELGLDMVDRDERIVLRSIRRKRGPDRLALWVKTAAALAGVARDRPTRLVELNPTCRPYELGWLLEAWCGREELAAPWEAS